ncbi:hypothetical protein E1B28_011312 [Marasmius oreades]|uniref:Zinc finger PHD-type domain-containing protein n=1 Tax=Marasmius oreades TaxID=181124 RepID=A0A9P7RUJ5_9AGAR|nr:uncharacterized protein E1B28_011312 [Marasmius oreades]KAG7089650.1 hypothetical protein E1B28_011312 [Marasmius oreades]
MPRRNPARTGNSNLAPQSIPIPPIDNAFQHFANELATLRTNWKWAAFSQFYFTFSPLFNMEEVTLQHIEDDLVRGSSSVLPRIMLRLLITLSNDRKMNLDTWQNALRRQYNRRDPSANHIGLEPPKTTVHSRYASVIEEEATPDPTPEFEPKIEEISNENGLDVSAGDNGSSVISREESLGLGSVPTKMKEEDQSVEEQEILQTAEPPIEECQSETKDWNTLPMLEKLESMHLLTEWQFQNPLRLRTIMKSDDETAEWRIEPIGYDAKRNAYWLIGADRLWIQRVPPKPPKTARPTKSNKRKRGATDTGNISKAKKARTSRSTNTSAKKGKRKGKVVAVLPQTKGKSKQSAEEPTTPGRHGRAAKAKANAQLEAQAKQLAELNRQAAEMTKADGRASRSTKAQFNSPSKSEPKAPTTPSRTSSRLTRNSSTRPLGTRISARLRGSDNADDAEWQAIPDEWLNGREDEEDDFEKTGLVSGGSSLSDLTELSDKEEPAEDDEEEEEEEEEEDFIEEVAEVEEVEEIPEEPTLPEDFIEWETICVTLYDWEHIAERWENATHYVEKALYKVLKNHIVPVITEELRAIENKRRIEEAIVHRKRSSRIAIKESEKEEARLTAVRKAEEEEKMGRQRRAEARQRKEEAERLKREQGREQRRKEREAQLAEREAREKEEQERSSSLDVSQDSKHQKKKVKRQPTTFDLSINGVASGSRTPAGDDWELDCEICHRRGINLDDGVPLMCCGKCAKWQHIPCHDKADERAGLPGRNWEEVEFVCRKCRSGMFSGVANSASSAYPHSNNRIALNQPLQPYQQYQPHPQSHRLSLPTSSQNQRSYPNPSYNNLSTSPYPHTMLTNPYLNGNDRMATSDIRSSPPQVQAHTLPQSKPLTFQHYQPPNQQHINPTSPRPSLIQSQYNTNFGTHVQAYGTAQYTSSATNGVTPSRSSSNFESWNAHHSYSNPYVTSTERLTAPPPQRPQSWHPQHLPPSNNLPSYAPSYQS